MSLFTAFVLKSILSDMSIATPAFFWSLFAWNQRRQWHPTPVLLPGKLNGWRSLVGCSPWGHNGSDTAELLHFHFAWNIFFHPSLSVCMCPLFWGGSLVDHIYRGLVFVSIQPVFVFQFGHSTHLHLKSLLISMIPLPFTLLFWVRVYTPFLCFLSREYPLVFVGELFWWCRILSAFACLKSFWFLLHTWMRSLLGTIIWAVGYFLSSF